MDFNSLNFTCRLMFVSFLTQQTSSRINTNNWCYQSIIIMHNHDDGVHYDRAPATGTNHIFTCTLLAHSKSLASVSDYNMSNSSNCYLPFFLEQLWLTNTYMYASFVPCYTIILHKLTFPLKWRCYNNTLNHVLHGIWLVSIAAWVIWN